ncbi:MAG TPA: helix-turn-helix domain-containing GNAT family N-acetyltransferase [Geminicoccus sp.]|jgi:DNA-binding MarR family transcriptional regulator/GNAT superfamily N-acetyltransferase|uniref:bifunctional helix-turn-helix transcriptional regulator/GNAT family N-acetyltransferase n=1 Tax=Geminicoccus sp. TaxID=2024832 RepID=UPI002E339C21|nr:helix-turn-helix domain-containing GNAT family N-acetyltransferase [Geminicoccus sp.]HEX2525813.1 helix-turn-helix domain-containing GNAT family N-acetyltransferase [Geminicoccus sp.]
MDVPAGLDGQVGVVRDFNRFYTRQLGLLEERLLDSAFSLTEARVLYELAHRDDWTATELGRELGLDAGYLSRILKRFAALGLLLRMPSPLDRRQSLLILTPAGRAAFEPLDLTSEADVAALLQRLSGEQRSKLVHAMSAVREILAGQPARGEPWVLRRHRPGDIGWVIHRQALLYAQEFGWNESYEALAAEILAKFVRDFDPVWESSWIVDRGGSVVGSVFLVKESNDRARLRLLYVEPSMRGSGLGRRLVDECIQFARARNYRTLTLWTNDVLLSARRIYEAAGFRVVDEARHRSFGQDLVGQNWDLDLCGTAVTSPSSNSGPAAP